MDTRIHLSLAAAVLLLAGCDPQPTTNQVSANTEALADAVANAQAGTTTAEPIHLTEKTAVIDFDYKIPARAAAAPALRDHLLADAETGKQAAIRDQARSEEHTSELQSLMRISYAVFCLKKNKPYKK